MDDMRKAFEAWAADEGFILRYSTVRASYLFEDAEAAWQAWQAATMAERERCAKAEKQARILGALGCE